MGVASGGVVDRHVRVVEARGEAGLGRLHADEGLVEVARVAVYGRLRVLIVMLLVVVGHGRLEGVGQHHVGHELALLQVVVRRQHGDAVPHDVVGLCDVTLLGHLLGAAGEGSVELAPKGLVLVLQLGRTFDDS